MPAPTKHVQSTVQLQLFGVPRYANGQPLPARMGHKQLVLFTRMLIEKRQLTREAMLAFLWPESNEVRARGSLRQALYVLRDVIGEEMLVADRHTVGFRVLPATDITRFIEATRAGQWWAAATSYHGPLLDGVHLKDATDAELWLELERRRMGRLFQTAAMAVLQSAWCMQDARDRIEIARQLRDTAPRSVLHWQYLVDELVRAGAHEECRIESAALGARLDTGQIDDTAAADALTRFVSTMPPSRSPPASTHRT